MAKKRRRGTGGVVERTRGDKDKVLYYARWRVSGLPKPVERIGGPYKSDATDLLARVERIMCEKRLDRMAAIRVACGEQNVDAPTFGKVLDDYLATLDGKRTPQNLKHEKWRANAIDEPLKRMAVRDVDSAAVARWTQRLSRDGKGGRTINRHLSLASQTWRYARRYGYVDLDKPNPFRADGLRSPEPKLDKDPLTPEEAASVVEKAPEDLRDILIAALATGCRLGELLSLTWDCVDLEEGYLVIRPENEKARRGRRVPLTDELRQTLRALRDTGPMRLGLHPSNPKAPVFLTRRGRPHSASTVHKRIQVLRTTLAKLEGFPARKGEKLKFKETRDAAVCNLLALGVPTATVARVVGHSNLSTTEKYLGKLVDAQRDAIKAYSAVRFNKVSETA